MSMTRGAKMLMVRNESNRARNEGGRNEMRNEMRYEGGSGGRNEMRYEGGSRGRNEMGYGEMRGEGGSGGRNEMRYEMRNEGEMRRGGSGGRNGYGDMNYPQNEYGGMNYGESRFRDRRGREHYDNGRFAPMNEMDGEMRGEMGYNEMRGEMRNARNEMRGAYGEMRGEGMRSEEMRGNYGGQSHYPFGPVPPIYEREQAMNRIGFVVPIGQGEVGSNFRNDASYSEMGHQRGEMMRGGASGEAMKLNEEMAHEWMQNLHNEDGTKGPHWTMEQVKQVMNQRGIKEDPVEFWAALNASYSDLCGVAKKHGVNTMDYYVDYAKAFWFDDKDAKEGKIARYFHHITK